MLFPLALPGAVDLDLGLGLDFGVDGLNPQ
jgi:hypothetical protein